MSERGILARLLEKRAQLRGVNVLPATPLNFRARDANGYEPLQFPRAPGELGGPINQPECAPDSHGCLAAFQGYRRIACEIELVAMGVEPFAALRDILGIERSQTCIVQFCCLSMGTSRGRLHCCAARIVCDFLRVPRSLGMMRVPGILHCARSGALKSVKHALMQGPLPVRGNGVQHCEARELVSERQCLTLCREQSRSECFTDFVLVPGPQRVQQPTVNASGHHREQLEHFHSTPTLARDARENRMSHGGRQSTCLEELGYEKWVASGLREDALRTSPSCLIRKLQHGSLRQRRKGDSASPVRQITQYLEHMEAASLVTALRPLMPTPPAGAPGPFALSDEATLREFALASGVQAGDILDVETPWRFATLALALRGLKSSGVAARAIAHLR